MLPSLRGDRGTGAPWSTQGWYPAQWLAFTSCFCPLVSKFGVTETRPRLPVWVWGCRCVYKGVHACERAQGHTHTVTHTVTHTQTRTQLTDGAASRGSIPLPWQPKRLPRQQDGHGDRVAMGTARRDGSVPTRDWRRKDSPGNGGTISSASPGTRWLPHMPRDKGDTWCCRDRDGGDKVPTPCAPADLHVLTGTCPRDSSGTSDPCGGCRAGWTRWRQP